MEILSPAGYYAAIFCTIMTVLFIAVLIGKFFYIAPFRYVYDVMVELSALMFMAVAGSLLVIPLWIGILTSIKGLVLVGILSSMPFILLFLSSIVLGFVFGVVPYMKDLHERIKNKHEGNE